MDSIFITFHRFRRKSVRGVARFTGSGGVNRYHAIFILLSFLHSIVGKIQIPETCKRVYENLSRKGRCLRICFRYLLGSVVSLTQRPVILSRLSTSYPMMGDPPLLMGGCHLILM